jgi:hypothetical protein
LHSKTVFDSGEATTVLTHFARIIAAKFVGKSPLPLFVKEGLNL